MHKQVKLNIPQLTPIKLAQSKVPDSIPTRGNVFAEFILLTLSTLYNYGKTLFERCNLAAQNCVRRDSISNEAIQRKI